MPAPGSKPYFASAKLIVASPSRCQAFRCVSLRCLCSTVHSKQTMAAPSRRPSYLCITIAPHNAAKPFLSCAVPSRSLPSRRRAAMRLSIALPCFASPWPFHAWPFHGRALHFHALAAPCSVPHSDALAALCLAYRCFSFAWPIDAFPLLGLSMLFPCLAFHRTALRRHALLCHSPPCLCSADQRQHLFAAAYSFSNS